LTHGSHNTRGSLPAWEKPVDQGSNPCVPTPRPRDVGKESPSSKTQRKSPIPGAHWRRLLVVEQNCAAMATPMSSPIAEGPVCSRCDHSEVEDLGSAGILEFYRCTRCRDVVVVQGSRRWAVTAILED